MQSAFCVCAFHLLIDLLIARGIGQIGINVHDCKRLTQGIQNVEGAGKDRLGCFAVKRIIIPIIIKKTINDDLRVALPHRSEEHTSELQSQR